jgi:hypothetical protein
MRARFEPQLAPVRPSDRLAAEIEGYDPPAHRSRSSFPEERGTGIVALENALDRAIEVRCRQPLMVNTFSSLRDAGEPARVAVMTEHVEGATTAVLMLNVASATPISLGLSVTLAGTVTDGLLLPSCITFPTAEGSATTTRPVSDPPPATELLDRVRVTGEDEFDGRTNS